MTIMASAAALLLLAFQTPPDRQAVEAALAQPRLNYCDELACYYRPLRRYEVRALTCVPGAAGTMFDCTYERAASPPVMPISVGPAPADTRSWLPAHTRFERLGQGWVVLADSDD